MVSGDSTECPARSCTRFSRRVVMDTRILVTVTALLAVTPTTGEVHRRLTPLKEAQHDLLWDPQCDLLAACRLFEQARRALQSKKRTHSLIQFHDHAQTQTRSEIQSGAGR